MPAMEIQKEKNMENEMGTEITQGFMRTRVGLEALEKPIIYCQKALHKDEGQ